MKKKAARKKPDLFFEVRFVGTDLAPDKISLRNVSDALSALQDLASGRDPYETDRVPHDKGIGLVKVLKGSAVYRCISRAPEEALKNLSRVGEILSSCEQNDWDELVAALNPIQSLSKVAKSVGCRVEVTTTAITKPLFVVTDDDFDKISSRLLLSGEATVVGQVERVGGATEMRCLLRVPGRRHLLYCDVSNKDLAQRIGQHLYEDIVATGTAVWIHQSWRIYKFRINGFTQPRVGDAGKMIEELRGAGLSAWDKVDDPEAYIKESRY